MYRQQAADSRIKDFSNQGMIKESLVVHGYHKLMRGIILLSVVNASQRHHAPAAKVNFPPDGEATTV